MLGKKKFSFLKKKSTQSVGRPKTEKKIGAVLAMNYAARSIPDLTTNFPLAKNLTLVNWELGH